LNSKIPLVSLAILAATFSFATCKQINDHSLSETTLAEEQSEGESNLPRMDPYSQSSFQNQKGLRLCFRWLYFRAFTDQMVSEMGPDGEKYRQQDYINQRDTAIQTYHDNMNYFNKKLATCCGRHEKFPASCEIADRLIWDFKLRPLKNEKVWGAPEWFAPTDIRFPSKIDGSVPGERPFNPQLIFNDTKDFQCHSSGYKVLIGYPLRGAHFWAIRNIGIGSGVAAMSLSHELGHAGRYAHPQGGSHAPRSDPFNVMADGRWSQIDDSKNYVDYQWCNSMATLMGYQTEQERLRNTKRL